jgi:hypothetical protein
VGIAFEIAHPAVVTATADIPNFLLKRSTHTHVSRETVPSPRTVRDRREVQADTRKPLPKDVLAGQLANKAAEDAGSHGAPPIC